MQIPKSQGAKTGAKQQLKNNAAPGGLSQSLSRDLEGGGGGQVGP